MNRHFLVTAMALFISLAALGQTDNKTTLEVKGYGKLSSLPDIARINITVKVKKDQFSQAVGELNKKTDLIYNQLEEIGFGQESIKTRDFRVNINRIFLEGQSLDSGYIGTQTVVAEFANEKETTGKIIQSFEESTIDVQFNFSFDISDAKRQELRNQLIKLAVDDAHSVAELIAEASHQELERMVEIKYGTFEYDNNAGSRFNESVIVGYSTAQNSPTGFGVKEMSFKDHVVVKWTLK